MSATEIRFTCEVDEYNQMDIASQIIPRLTDQNRKELLKMLVRQFFSDGNAEQGILQAIAEYICLRQKDREPSLLHPQRLPINRQPVVQFLQPSSLLSSNTG